MAAQPIRPIFSDRLLDWTGNAILYVLLLAIPYVAARWVAEVLPIVLQPIGRIIANAVILPLLYLALHLLLRVLGLQCRNFISLVVLIFVGITFMELQRAQRTGDYNAWVSVVVAGVYVVVFAAFTVHSLIVSRREWRDRRLARDRAEAQRQAEAFSKARQVGP